MFSKNKTTKTSICEEYITHQNDSEECFKHLEIFKTD